MGQAKRKQEAARRLVESVDLSIFQTPEVRAAVREHMVRRGLADQVSKAEARGDVSQGPRSPLTAVRECAEAAQAGDATAARSASPLHASSETGAGAKTRESVVSSPRNQAGLGDGKTVEHQTQLSALVPDELCDIDDLPDCLVGGVHQPHCRHAGKPVTKGGNP